MTKFYHVATVATLAASPAFAQDFYAGGTLSYANAKSDTGSVIFESDITSFSLLAGARYEVGNSMFVGAEVEASVGSGFDGIAYTWANVEDSQTTIQGELHLGYQADGYAIYGFYGLGSNRMKRDFFTNASRLEIFGIGADIEVADNIAMRVEAEMSSMSFDGCASYDVELNRVSVGAIYKF